VTLPLHFPEPESIALEVAGRRIHISCWGDAEAPVVLLIHGIRDHSRSWDWVANALAGNYRIYAPDLRGHGDSDWAAPNGYTLAEFGMDLADIVEALRLDRLAVVGHSFGGHHALRLAACWPERVTAVSGIECVELPIVREERAEPKPHPHRLRNWMETIRANRERRPRQYATIADAAARMQQEHPQVDPETIHHLARHGVALGPDGTYRWKFDQSARLRPPDDADGRDLDQILAGIECPVQLFYGDASWVPFPPAERIALLRKLSLVNIPGVSHWLHHQAREHYISELRAFLASHHQGPPTHA
jgi:pimeloyl-ACP methyl ester carboxylesterase